MKTVILMLCAFLLLACSLKNKGTKLVTTASVHETSWRDINLDQEEIKTFRVIIHIFNRSDGSGNFQKDNVDHNYYVKSKIKKANKILANLETHIPGQIEHVSDSKIRLKVLKMYHWSDDTAYNSTALSKYNHNWLFAKYVGDNLALSEFEKKYCLHILLPGQKPKFYGGRNLTGLGFITNALYFEGLYQVYTDELGANVKNNIVHELGHGLGLPHYESSNFPCYTCDPNQPCPQEGCNNFMLGNGSGQGMTLCQLKVAHFLLKYGPSGLDIYNQSARANELIEGFVPNKETITD